MPILTYWLTPAEPARSYFASLISDLARRFDAPVFEPHLTLYATRAGGEDAEELLARTVAGRGAIPLCLTGVDFADEFTKTVFVQFQPNEELIRWSRKLRDASAFQNEYELNPHLSLIYKTLPSEIKEEIAGSLSLPFQEVHFDSAKAVITPDQIEAREDVEAWRVVASQKLSG